ncbi:DUF4160 domain-containing protein [bacterium]|nr:DUF4160 domain-containing protein [bacterium]
MSPTILRSGPYRLFFFSNEVGEPPLDHVQRERMLARSWLGPVQLAHSTGFVSRELRRIERVVTKHEKAIPEAWHEYFPD